MKFSFLGQGQNQVSNINKTLSELENVLKKSKKKEDFLENLNLINSMFRSMYHSLEILLFNMDEASIISKLEENNFIEKTRKILEQFFFLYEKYQTKLDPSVVWLYLVVHHIYKDYSIKTKNKTLKLLLFLTERTLPFEFLLSELINEIETIKHIFRALFSMNSNLLKKLKAYIIFLKTFEYLHINNEILDNLVEFSLDFCLEDEGKINNLLTTLNYFINKSTNYKKVISKFIEKIKTKKLKGPISIIKHYEKLYEIGQFTLFNVSFEMFLLYNSIKNKFIQDDYSKLFLSLMEISSYKEIFEDYIFSYFNVSESVSKKLSEFEFEIKIKMTGKAYKLFLKELILTSSKIIQRTTGKLPKTSTEFIETIKSNKLLMVDPIVSIFYDILKNKRKDYEISIKYKIEPSREYVYLNNKLLPLTASEDYISFLRTVRYLVLPYSTEHYKLLNTTDKSYEKDVNIAILEKLLEDKVLETVFLPICYENQYFVFLLPNKTNKFLLVFEIDRYPFINKYLLPQAFRTIMVFDYSQRSLRSISFKDLVRQMETIKLEEVPSYKKLK